MENRSGIVDMMALMASYKIYYVKFERKQKYDLPRESHGRRQEGPLEGQPPPGKRYLTLNF